MFLQEKRTKTLKKRVSKLNGVVKKLENSLVESHQNDRQMLATIHNDTVKHQKLVAQLEEAQKENKQLLSLNLFYFNSISILKCYKLKFLNCQVFN